MPAACLLALLPLVLASCSWDFLRWPARAWRGDPWAIRAAESGGGHLVVHEGVPILHLHGTPEEMGIQEGRLVGRLFRELRRTYLADFLGEEYESYRNVAQPFTTLMPPPHLEELQGFARGAREPLAEVVLANTFLDLSRAARCSALVAHGEAAKDGALLFARNLDFPDLGVAHKASLVKVYHPAGGRAFLSIGWPGMIGVTSGMNDAGLCVATLISLSEAGVESGEPYTMMNRRILEQCSTPEQAVKLVQATTRTCANSLVVAGQDGAALVIEFTAAKVAVRRPDRGVLVATNMFRSKEHVPQPTQICERFIRLERLAAASYGKLDLTELETILRAVGQQSPRLTTLQSMVFEPAALRLHVAIGSVPACDGEFVTLDASQLFESPL
jgi:predicted choloylglycine hydrolase